MGSGPLSSIIRRIISLLFAPGKATRPVNNSYRQQPIDLQMQ